MSAVKSGRPGDVQEIRCAAALRYKFPTQTPLRWLLMASLCGLGGFVETVAWAASGLPDSLLHGGLILLALGLLLFLRATLFLRRARWTLSLGPEGMTIRQGARQRMFSWTEVRGVDTSSLRISIRGRSAELARLVFDAKACNPRLLAEMVAQIDQRAAG